MKRNCKTCTLNTTNDTVETCKRMCYLRYSKQRNKRICDLEQEMQKLKQTLTEIKEIAERDKGFCDKCDGDIEIDCVDCHEGGRALLAKEILQKISEVTNEN